jgi:hypothetical protein
MRQPPPQTLWHETNPFREFDTEPRRDRGALPRESPLRLNETSASPTRRSSALYPRQVDDRRKATVVLSGDRRERSASPGRAVGQV